MTQNSPSNDDARNSNVQDISDPLTRLIRSLQKASDVYTHHNQREGAAKALIALHAYVSRVIPHENSQILRPLAELIGALTDANKGLRNPLTAPEWPSGGQGKGFSEATDLAIAAATVTLFIDAGILLDEATRKVAREMPKLTSKSLISIRKNMMAERGKNYALIDGYKYYVEFGRTFAPVPPLTKMQRAEQMLSFLKRRLGKV